MPPDYEGAVVVGVDSDLDDAGGSWVIVVVLGPVEITLVVDESNIGFEITGEAVGLVIMGEVWFGWIGIGWIVWLLFVLFEFAEVLLIIVV